MAFLFPVEKNAERPNKYKEYFEDLNHEDIEMPMAVTDIDKFEKMNDLIIMFMVVVKMEVIYVPEE